MMLKHSLSPKCGNDAETRTYMYTQNSWWKNIRNCTSSDPPQGITNLDTWVNKLWHFTKLCYKICTHRHTCPVLPIVLPGLNGDGHIQKRAQRHTWKIKVTLHSVIWEKVQEAGSKCLFRITTLRTLLLKRKEYSYSNSPAIIPSSQKRVLTFVKTTKGINGAQQIRDTTTETWFVCNHSCSNSNLAFKSMQGISTPPNIHPQKTTGVKTTTEPY